MARKRYTAEQIIGILRTLEIDTGKGTSVEEACRKAGVAVVTYHRWKKEYGGVRIDQAKRLRELEQENAKLKKVVANLALDNQILKEAASGNY
jgi:transposase-like protein